MIVDVETVARMCARDGFEAPQLPVLVTMRYNPTDPYAVQFVFRDGTGLVPWFFARDLLAGGMSSRDPVGDLDVQCWRGLGPGLLWLKLSNVHGTATFAFNRSDVTRFVKRSYALVKRGRESEHLDLDACVAALLEAKP